MLTYLESNKNKLSGSRTLALPPLSLLGLVVIESSWSY